MKKKILFKILFIISLITFLYSFLNIIKWEKDNRTSQDIVNELQNMITPNISTPDDSYSHIFVNSENEDKNSSYWYYVGFDMLNVNFCDLLQRNNDTKGWIFVPGTNINYPFVQTKDNEYYLNHSYDKKYNEAGWIFLDYRNDVRQKANLSDFLIRVQTGS